MCLSLARRLLCCACAMAAAIVLSAYYVYYTVEQATRSFVVAIPDAALMLNAARDAMPT